MNKNILYIGIAVIIGLLGGYLLFNDREADINTQKITDDHNHAGATSEHMWTCAMHPQIKQLEAGDCPICGMNLIPIETSAVGLAANEIRMTENAIALANIQTSIVGTSISNDEQGMVALSGKIAVNVENNSVQASYFDGRIEKLNVNYEGQEIQRGDLLASIYAPNLVAAQQELITAISLKESQPALYKAVRNKLKLWKLSDAQINTIEKSGKVSENFSIYATVSGTVSMMMAAEGDYVKQGQPIVKLSNLNSVWAEFDVYENQISQFKKGQKIKITTPVYSNKEFDALISFIDPVLNNETRTVTVRATLNNKDDIFKPGMFVTGKVEGNIENSNEQLIIPASALMWTGERSLVYVKTSIDEPVFEMREITIGSKNGENYSIISGIKSGEEIVTNGTFTVDAAAQLQGKKSMMNSVEDKRMRSTTSTTDSSLMINMKFPEQFQKDFSSTIEYYLKMKDAFVASNAIQITAMAKIVLKQFKELPTEGLGKMQKAYLNKSIETLVTIVENQNLENQRAHFVTLNENMIAIVMNIKPSDNLLYVQQCPMANNNKSAKWLSNEKTIRNPYFGDAMLTCGSVVEEIK